MRQQLVILAAVLTAQACGQKQQECQADVADFVDFMHSMKDEPGGIATGARLPLRPDAKDSMQSASLVVEVLPTGALFNGVPVNASSLPGKLIDRIMQLSRASNTFKAQHVW